MTVKERVDKIKGFFVNMNVADGAICVAVKFPNTWQMEESSSLREKFKCELASQNGCEFFMTEMENGFDVVFDCIDYIIETNRSIEEKSELLKQKAKELTDLFIAEPLERLKGLYFAFSEPATKSRKRSTKSKTEKPVEIKQDEETVVDQTTDTDEKKDETVSSMLEIAEKIVK